jgi:hypothetical protein
MLESAWLTYQSSRDICAAIVDQVASLARSKDDYDFVQKMRIKCAEAIAKIKPGKFKGLDDATKQIVQVADDLVKRRKEAQDYIRSLADSGRDLDQEAAIKLVVGTARAELLQIQSEFNARAEELRAKVRKEAPNVAWDPVEVRQFGDVFKKSSDALLAIARTGDQASEAAAKTTADEAVKNAAAKRDKCLQSMSAYADGDNFAMFVADMRRRDAVVSALREVRETLEQLDRWGASEAARIAADATGIEKEMDHVFTDRSGLSASEAQAAETAQDALLGKAVALKATAKSAIASTEASFNSEIDALRPNVEALEGRWTACKTNFGNIKQIEARSGPIVAQLAATRLALDGLNGFNIAAIDAVKKTIKESTDLVSQAEHIKELNKQILATLKEADTVAKALTGKENPIADVFVKHRAEIKTFEKEFEKKPLNDATKGAQELLAQVGKDAQRNQKLIDRRRDIMKRIERRETQLAEFNLLFRQMLEHAGQTPKDYRGSFKADLETCKNWAATKTDPDFYKTIDARLTSMLTEMDKEAGNIRLLLSKSNKDLMMDAATAATTHRDANLDLNRRDGAALARLASAQEKLADIQLRLDKDETVPEDEIKAARDALAAANEERGEIADERAAVQKQYDEATFLLDRQTQLVSELGRAEAADEIAERKKEQFLEESKVWLADIKKKVSDKNKTLSDYKDEAKPQIERVETARKMLKEGKPGVTGASALSEMTFVKKFLEGLEKNGRKTDRRNLGAIGDEWDKEVVKISNAASKLIAAVEGFEKLPQVEGRASADVERLFGLILGRMQDHAFEQAAVTFNGSEDKQVRKAAREQALSEVRRYRALIFNDPLFQKCVMNPFGEPVGSTTANRLDQIELNVLRGI